MIEQIYCDLAMTAWNDLMNEPDVYYSPIRRLLSLPLLYSFESFLSYDSISLRKNEFNLANNGRYNILTENYCSIFSLLSQGITESSPFCLPNLSRLSSISALNASLPITHLE